MKARLLLCLLSLLTIMIGKAEFVTVEVGQFEKLKINGNINVVYKNLPDSTGLARYDNRGEENPTFKFTSKGDGNLKVEPSDDNWSADDLPVLYLYSDFLSAVESYSDKAVEILSVAPSASFSLNQIGNGSITADNVRCNNLSASITTGNGSIFVSGSCLNANFRMVGTGLISADRLKADNIKCRILGTGSIGCWPLENLNITGLGTTKIYYKGKPNIKKTGGGKLFELPEEMDEEVYSRLGTPVPSLNAPVEEVNDAGEEEGEEEEYRTIVSAEDDD